MFAATKGKVDRLRAVVGARAMVENWLEKWPEIVQQVGLVLAITSTSMKVQRRRRQNWEVEG